MKAKPHISIIVPAWNEQETIGATLQALRYQLEQSPIHEEIEIIVVDDGSDDQTAAIAAAWADKLVSLGTNRGKGAAVAAGCRRAEGELLVLLDADLGGSAACYPLLLAPLQQGVADMTIARLPRPQRRGGFGLVRRLASLGIYALSGYRCAAPLSGQRALRRALLERIVPERLASGFGLEVGLTIDAVRAGGKVCEVEVPFVHRETGRDWYGFRHRGKQFAAVGKTLILKWGERR